MHITIPDDLADLKFEETVKIIFSVPRHTQFDKVVIRPILLKTKKSYQIEKYVQKQVLHANIEASCLALYIENELLAYFGHIHIILQDNTIEYRISKKGKIFRKSIPNKNTVQVDLNHNKSKSYLLKEGMPILPLVDLGVFDEGFHIIQSKYDKFKQINRFVEILNDEFEQYRGKEISILDFGCGKSYLTFIVYYYFVHLKGIQATITGYDLKKDVVDNCNAIAQKYRYENLSFVVGDISKNNVHTEKTDVMITLHACDTATDFALHHAIKNHIQYIFSVPCCQHELNQQICHDGQMSVLLEHGLIKERFSALLTDAIRCEILKQVGYAVDAIEFVDFDSSPKNLMIRARRKDSHKEMNNTKLNALMADFHIYPKLVDLLRKDKTL